MDDLQKIDLVEKIKSHLSPYATDLESGADGVAKAAREEQGAPYYRQQFLAIVFDIDDSGPAGRRQLRRLARLIEQPPEEILASETVAEAPDNYLLDTKENPWDRHPAWKKREQVTAALDKLSPGLDGESPVLIAKALSARHLREAADLLRRELRLLTGLKFFRFLEAVGRPLILPDSLRKHFFFRLGLTTQVERASSWPEEFFSAGETLAHLTGESLSALDRMFGLYTGAIAESGRLSPICVKRPRCHLCVVNNYCAWRRFQSREEAERPSGGKIKQMAESERPRERLAEKGAASLSETELLAILLRTGSGELSALDLASLLLKRFKTLGRIDQSSLAEMCEVRGVGPAKAIEIKAALELGRRLESKPDNDDKPLSTPEEIYQRFRLRLANLNHEEFYIVLVNTKLRVIREALVSQGTLQGSLAHPREVFKEAIRESAYAMVLVHNHPSGDPEPSSNDIELTKRLVEAGKILGVRILDHVIIGRHDFCSFSRSEIMGNSLADFGYADGG
jgi:DNA repair protein RadC